MMDMCIDAVCYFDKNNTQMSLLGEFPSFREVKMARSSSM